MGLYDGIECPVCHQAFQEGDDVVCCPVCGTPHHRACYNAVGHCVNEKLHESGFVFDREKEKAQKDSAPDAPFDISPLGKVKNGETAAEDPVGPAAGQNSAEQPKARANGSSTPFSGGAGANSMYADARVEKYRGDARHISGRPLYEWAVAVGTNVDRFIGRFLAFSDKKKKLSWNWGAFFFGAYYFFWRKATKPGILFLLVEQIINVLVTAFFYQPYQTYMNTLYQSLRSGEALTNSQLVTSAEFQAVLPAFLIVGALTLAEHIVCALLADRLYMKRTLELIEKSHEKVEDGEDLMQMNPFFGQPAADLGGKNYLYFLIASGGSTSIFSPVIAYCLMDIALGLIMQLVSVF